METTVKQTKSGLNWNEQPYTLTLDHVELHNGGRKVEEFWSLQGNLSLVDIKNIFYIQHCQHSYDYCAHYYQFHNVELENGFIKRTLYLNV